VDESVVGQDALDGDAQPSELDRRELGARAAHCPLATGLLVLKVIESGPAAAFEIVGIGLIGAAGAPNAATAGARRQQP
jgi:hypothetical protein